MQFPVPLKFLEMKLASGVARLRGLKTFHKAPITACFANSVGYIIGESVVREECSTTLSFVLRSSSIKDDILKAAKRLVRYSLIVLWEFHKASTLVSRGIAFYVFIYEK